MNFTVGIGFLIAIPFVLSNHLDYNFSVEKAFSFQVWILRLKVFFSCLVCFLFVHSRTLSWVGVQKRVSAILLTSVLLESTRCPTAMFDSPVKQQGFEVLLDMRPSLRINPRFLFSRFF